MMATSTPLVAIELLAACVWVGSLACLAVVTAAARTVLDGPFRVELFRAIGRRYAIVGTTSLLVAVGAGLALVWPPSGWSVTIDVAAALTGAVVLATAAGIAQARAMTRRRRRALDRHQDQAAARAVRRGRLVAGVLRAVMAALTVAVVVLAAGAVSQWR